MISLLLGFQDVVDYNIYLNGKQLPCSFSIFTSNETCSEQFEDYKEQFCKVLHVFILYLYMLYILNEIN